MTVPEAPWELAGECVIALARRRGAALGPLPAGHRRAPGPIGLTAANFHASPVGPYVEFVVAEPVRSRCRIRPCVTTMAVDSAASRVAGRLNWGFPKELGRLVWTGSGDERLLWWEERKLELRALAKGPRLPMVVPVRVRQRRGDDAVVVPARLHGWGRIAEVKLAVPDDDALRALAGDHWGVHVAGACLVVGAARAHAGGGGVLRALRTAPEPALSWGGNQGD